MRVTRIAARQRTRPITRGARPRRIITRPFRACARCVRCEPAEHDVPPARVVLARVRSTDESVAAKVTSGSASMSIPRGPGPPSRRKPISCSLFASAAALARSTCRSSDRSSSPRRHDTPPPSRRRPEVGSASARRSAPDPLLVRERGSRRGGEEGASTRQSATLEARPDVLDGQAPLSQPVEARAPRRVGDRVEHVRRCGSA